MIYQILNSKDIVYAIANGRLMALFDLLQERSAKGDFTPNLDSNFDAEERSRKIRKIYSFQKVAEELEEAMNEGGQKSKLQWWVDWDNEFLVCICCFPCAVFPMVHQA